MGPEVPVHILATKQNLLFHPQDADRLRLLAPQWHKPATCGLPISQASTSPDLDPGLKGYVVCAEKSKRGGEVTDPI
ncbi:uncharacterized protein N7503_004973 [Penicillium pulvis]|uniref:uncharacterized protein n=1 Tax=Penicillium pulvis TaxID=1562058 RepID=UPI0025495286|nr:uncharacterized protein N7503_004973 [Penicillium pulvis]KAJ5802523.1 hypothetical protein N7503_004973 [Penicillium pulvis]